MCPDITHNIEICWSFFVSESQGQCLPGCKSDLSVGTLEITKLGSRERTFLANRQAVEFNPAMSSSTLSTIPLCWIDLIAEAGVKHQSLFAEKDSRSVPVVVPVVPVVPVTAIDKISFRKEEVSFRIFFPSIRLCIFCCCFDPVIGILETDWFKLAAVVPTVLI